MSGPQTIAARFARALLLVAGAMLLASTAVAQDTPTPDEAKVKAAFLLRFAQFVGWPQTALPQPDTPLVIGIVGNDAIAAELVQQAVASRATIGRPVTVRTLKPGEDLPPLHVLFVGADERRLGQYASTTRSRHVLLVTESQGALEQGSMINFVIAERRVKFEIALEPAEKAGLTLSSRLLSVAMRVLKGELRLEPYPVAAR